MNRQEAIGIIESGYSMYVGEYTCTPKEHDESFEELYQAFESLGVSRIEIPGTSEWNAELERQGRNELNEFINFMRQYHVRFCQWDQATKTWNPLSKAMEEIVSDWRKGDEN